MSFYYDGKKIKRVGIFGLGKSNTGVISYLKARYPEITYTLRADSNINIQDAMRVTKFEKVIVGRDAISGIDEDLIFLSPSAKRERFNCCRAKLSSDAELFFKSTKREVFAVSGSDGKSTTATLTSLILTNSGIKNSCIGNVGEAMSPHIDEDFATVAELSSFQLKYLNCSFGRSVITNITPNHLDWHKTLEDYINSKLSLAINSREPILNSDDAISLSLLEKVHPYAVFSLTKDGKEIKSIAKAELYGYLNDGFICVNGEKILDTGAIKSKNRYNTANFMAAILLSYGYANENGIYRTARSFDTLRHRCEFIGEYDGITFIDSSIDSTPKRCITTLDALGKRVTVILGGRSKGLDYSLLIPYLTKYATAVIITGECSKDISAVLSASKEYKDAEIHTVMAQGFEDAVLCAIRNTKNGGTVLLSPASTSYDSFKNFEERGQRFKEIITKYYKGR